MARELDMASIGSGESASLRRAAQRIGWIAAGGTRRDVGVSIQADAQEVADLLLALVPDLVDAALERRLGPVAAPARDGVAVGDTFERVDSWGGDVAGAYEVTELCKDEVFGPDALLKGASLSYRISVAHLLDATACPGWRRVEVRTPLPTTEQMDEAVERTRGWMARRGIVPAERVSGPFRGILASEGAVSDLDGPSGDVRAPGLTAAAEEAEAWSDDVRKLITAWRAEYDGPQSSVAIDALIERLAARVGMPVPSRLAGAQ